MEDAKSAGAWPEIPLYLDRHRVRAVLFALPVVALRADLGGVSGGPVDIAPLGALLHGPGQMGSEAQGLFLVPQLVSGSMLAHLADPGRAPRWAATLIDACERTALEGTQGLAAGAPIADGDAGPLPLRFLVGCAYRFDESTPVNIVSPRAWRGELQRRVEVSFGALLQRPAGEADVCPRPRVLAPRPWPGALTAGLRELLRQAVATAQGPVHRRWNASPDGQVVLQLTAGQRVLTLRLSPALLGVDAVQGFLADVDDLLAHYRETAHASDWPRRRTL